MARSGVERTRRTAARPARPASPRSLVGRVRSATAPAVRRLALRALAVAGLAGAAWLLSAAAAQAADNDDLFQPLLARDAVQVPAGPAAGLTAAHTDRPDTRALLDSLPSVPSELAVRSTLVASPGTGLTQDDGRRLAVPHPAHRLAAGPGDQAAAGPRASTADFAGLSRLDLRAAIHRLAEPLGLARPLADPGPALGPLAPLDQVVEPVVQPLHRVVDPVVAPLTGVLRPIVGAVRSTAASHAPRSPLAGGRRLADTPRSGDWLVPGVWWAGPSWPDRDGYSGSRPGGVAGPRAVAPVRAVAPHRAGPAARTGSDSVTDERATGRRPGAKAKASSYPARLRSGGAGRQDLPSRPGPAPLRGHLGVGSGISTTGSGSAGDGGGFAVVPFAVTGSAVASHRLPRATAVEVPRRFAEDLTVSPD